MKQRTNKLRQSKKAQIKIFESIIVLVLFVFIVAIGVKFYTNVQLQSLKEAQQKFSRLDSVKTSISLTNLPEIGCSFEAIPDSSCTDLFKVKAWDYLLNSSVGFKDYYYSQLGESNIVIENLYPEKKNYTIYYAPPRKNQSNSDYIMVPTIMYNPATGLSQLGMINIRTYYK